MTISVDALRGSDFAQLCRQIRAAKLLDRKPGHYITRIALTGASLIATWWAFVWVGNSWFTTIIAAVMGLVFTQVAFLGHDGGHQQVGADQGGQRPARHRRRRSADRPELRLVARQAQPAPRAPESRGPRPRHRRRRAGVHDQAGRQPRGRLGRLSPATRRGCSSRC